MELTAAEPRRHRLTQLYIDGEQAVKVDTETFLRSGLRLGDELDDEELHQLIQASDAHRAREKALYLLEHRAHSKKELTEKLPAPPPAERPQRPPQTAWRNWGF